MIIAIILGIIEGITEFLPISSTAHIRIVQSLMGLSLEDEYWKMFSVVIQMGAISAVVVYFRLRVISFFSLKSSAAHNRTLLLKVLLAFVMTAGPTFILRKLVGKNLESLFVMGSALLGGGIVILIVDRLLKNPNTNNVEEMTWMQAAGVGLIQNLSAIFPGTSRSMSTIVGGQLMGLARHVALEFSFLVSIPTMFAATAYDLFKTWKFSDVPILTSSEQWINLIVGTLVSFFVAWLVIAWFMSWVRRRGFVVFGVYRILLGLYVLNFLV